MSAIRIIVVSICNLHKSLWIFSSIFTYSKRTPKYGRNFDLICARIKNSVIADFESRELVRRLYLVAASQRRSVAFDTWYCVSQLRALISRERSRRVVAPSRRRSTSVLSCSASRSIISSVPNVRRVRAFRNVARSCEQ